MISENVPPIILAPIIEYSKISPNFPRNVNRLSRPVLQHSKVNNQYGGNSTVSITGIPYAVDSQKQFMNQVYITFLGYDKILQHNIPGATSVIKAEINVMIRVLLNTNRGLKNYVQQCSEPLNKLTEYYAYLKSNDKGANVAVIGNEEITHEIITEAACLKDKFSDGKYKKTYLYANSAKYDQLVYPLIFWDGKGGCGKLDDEDKWSIQDMRFVCRSILYQPMKHYIHKLSTLREEFLCSLYGRIMKMRIDYAFKRQLLQYMSDMVLHPQISSDKGDIKTFIPKTLSGSPLQSMHRVLRGTGSFRGQNY